MQLSNQQLEWQFCEEEESADAAWPAAGVEPTLDGKQGSERKMQWPLRFYELTLGFAVIYGMAVFLIWQQAERRLAMLEQEISAMCHLQK